MQQPSPWIRSRRAVWLGIALSIVIAGVTRGQDSLPTITRNVREGATDEPSSGSSSARSSGSWWSSSGSHRHCDDDDGDNLFGNLILYTATSPYWLPHFMLDSGWSQQLQFPAFPYDNGPGYLQTLAADSEAWIKLRKSHHWGGRLAFEYGNSFDEQYVVGGRGQVDTSSRLGLEADVRRWQEASGSWQGDRIWLGEVDFTVRFAQNEHWMFRSGLGVNWLSDVADTNFGFNFTYGVDWFPVRPLVFSSEIDLGSLGEAWLFHARTSAGMTWQGTEIYAAYDYYDIGDGQLNAMSLGLRFWF